MPKLPRPLLIAMLGLSVIFYRLFGNRVRVLGAPLLLLTTTGARSSKRRRTLLGWFADETDESWLVVASYAGSARHPAWYLNMARCPDEVWIEVGNRKLKVRPESLKGAEREATWRRIVSQSPGYGAYQHKTDREMPIIRLRPTE
jgi:deazaflavin-dependent oxidoreductase (nitroreductase family)